MNKYKLLTFNEDYGDEHNVPALCVMSEEQYKIWLKTPSGTLNPNYESEKKASDDYNLINQKFWKTLESKGYTINGIANTTKIPKNDLETLQLEKELRALKYPRHIKRVLSNMRAYLGNDGECFEEAYSDLYLMEEFVSKGLVKVTDVDESFVKVFNDNKLSNLSLCNVFKIIEE